MSIKENIKKLGKNAKAAAKSMAIVSSEEKNKALKILSDNIKNYSNEIINANQKDIENARKNALPSPLVNRLSLTTKSIEAIAINIGNIINLPDPIGKILEEWERPNGLKFKKISVPLGVIGVIYESRPNVTVDATCLAMKSGNVVILRGGSDSFFSSNKLVEIISKSFLEAKLTKHITQMIPTVDREAVDHLLQMKEYEKN